MHTTTTERVIEKNKRSVASPFSVVETINSPFSAGRMSIEVEADEYPLGSQGSVTTVADRYFEPFDIMRVKTSEANKEQSQDFKHFSGKQVVVQPTKKVKKAKDSADSKLISLVKKDRTAVVVYSAVLVFLFALILATGFTVTALQKSVASLEAGVAEARNRNAQLSTEIVVESNESVIMDKAEELGMVKSGQTIEVALVATSDPIEYTPMTNWFDIVCDFLSGVFG